MLRAIWLVPALPLAGAIVNLAAGRRLREWSGWLAAAVVAASFLLSLVALVDLVGRSAADRVSLSHLYDWIAVGSFHVGVNLRVDPLSMTMILVVTGVGVLIHVYAIGYMHGDERFSRFFSYLNLFVFFMLMLVLADNFLLMYLGWEGVGLCSYLLIGFWFERPKAANAAKKAFIVTRIGDTAMLIGIALIFVTFGSLDFGHVLGAAGSGVSKSAATVIALLLFAGAVGKSAQVPLHVWLPDAMEGPTPVSALIHAATMVTAGVYLVVRTHVLFETSGTALTVVLVIGLLTALYAATAALGQDDIKRVLAYSTISQLGFMFFAAGLKAYAAAMFLLVTHAFYKALMFLAAGSVMHGLDNETDLKRMGGLAKAMPATAAAFGIGALALSGVPPFAGFFSKDQILAAANQGGHAFAYLVALVAAFFSALYIARLIFLAFFGRRRSDIPVHESPPLMTFPLAVLSVGAVGGGLLGLSAANGTLARFLTPVVGAVPQPTSGTSEVTLTVISVLVAVAGIAVAYVFYGSGKVDWAGLRERNGVMHRSLERGWYVDAGYAAVVEHPGKAFARFLAFVVDARIIDGAVNGIGVAFRGLAAVGRRVQTGFVRSYALGFLLGAAAILLYVGWRL
ncbi:MAG: NADH-quinone oxidoreductase subunit L [Actinomycetota bacterium]|nr:NADH-quinone oxidoreductase subunit L [Actinomycetota bacterium]